MSTSGPLRKREPTASGDVARAGFPPFAAVVAIALASGAWLLAVAAFGPTVPAVLLAPGVLLAAAAGATLFGAAALCFPRAIAGLVVLVAFGLSISFRIREQGETGLDLQNGIKLMVWLLLPVIAFLNARRIAFCLRDPLVATMALYAAIAVASTAWSPIPAYTGASALGLSSYLLLACLAAATSGEAALLRLLIFTLVTYALLTLASAVLLPQMAWMLPAGGGDTTLRLQGLSGHPNVLGEQMAVLVTLSVIARREGVIGRPAFLVGIASGFPILIGTESRTTLFAVIVSWGIVAARQRKLLLPVVCAMGLLAAVAILSVALGYEPVPKDLLATVSRSGSLSELTTLTGRTDLWEVAVELIGARPLHGWGFNGTEALFVANVGRGFVGDPVNAHNMYLQSALSLGLVGSLPGFAVLAILIGRMIRVPDPTRDQFVLLVLFIGLAEVGIFATPTLLTLVFFMFLAFEALNAPSPAMRSPFRRTGDAMP